MAEAAQAPISLYFDLEPGQVADLEVVARAAIAWSAAIKELAYILDPSMEVRVEVNDATRSSFSFNALVKAVHAKYEDARSDPTTLKAIVLALVIHFGWGAVDHLFEKLLDHGPEEVVLSPEQIDEIVERVAKAGANPVAQKHLQQVFREAERDPAIKGVGVTPDPATKPPVVVPRSEFAVRAGHGQIREETIRKRTVPNEEMVVLVKPVLEPGSRRWSLRSATGEHGYIMKDTNFVERVLSGTTSVPMVMGIEMFVETETIEEFKNGVWEPTERTVTKVLNLRRPPIQPSMLPTTDGPEPDEDND